MRKEDLLTIHKALELMQTMCTNHKICKRCDLAINVKGQYYCSLDHIPANYDDAIKLMEYKYNKLYSASAYGKTVTEKENE